MEIQVENRVDIEPVTDVEIAASNAAEVSVTSDTALDVSVVKKEYKIVGDEVYIAKLYEDAPQWMKDLVQLVVDNTVEQSNIQLLNSVVEQLNQFATSYVPLNTYTQQILDLSNADASMHTLIETINSNFNNGLDEANAQIIGLENTKASKDEVIAQVLTTISAQLATLSSDLGATIANLQQAIVNGDSANADSITTLTSVLEGEVDARATAISALDTRVTATETAITAQATDITALTTEVSNGTNTWAAADSQVTNRLTTKIENDVASVESKWEYNSVVGINGVYKKSGFGLTTNYSGGSGTKVDPYTSEFWIDATKLKFTNSATTGRTAPFTIDASGTTPQITFNGKVSFSNVTGAPGGGSNLLYNSAPMVANETKGWSVGWYNTGITPTLGAGWDPWRPSGGGSVYAVVPGAPAIGTVFDVAQTTKVPVIGGMWYEASAYVSSHRCTSYVTIAWYDSNNTYINEVGGSQAAVAAGGALVNWSRSTLLAQAPANAARAHFYIRSIVNSTDPYCFAAFAYLGKAVQGQAVFSDWSEGTSAGVSSGEVVNDINNGNTTTIDGERLTTGSITANKIAANSITAGQIAAGSVTADRLSSTNGIGSVWTGGGLVSQNFNGNVNGAIGAPTQGFRLSSNATGTSADPNIYGGYIKGGAIEGAQLIGTMLSVNDIKVAAVGYPNNYGPIVLIEAYSGATTNTSSVFYSRWYSIGYNNKRMCSVSQIFVLQALTAGGTHSTNVIGTTAVSIMVSIDGGPWTTIASSSSYSGTASCAITYTADSTKNVQFLSTHSSKYIDSSTFSIQSINGQ